MMNISRAAWDLFNRLMTGATLLLWDNWGHPSITRLGHPCCTRKKDCDSMVENLKNIRATFLSVKARDKALRYRDPIFE